MKNLEPKLILFFLFLILLHSCKGYKAKFNEIQEDYDDLLTERNECIAAFDSLMSEEHYYIVESNNNNYYGEDIAEMYEEINSRNQEIEELRDDLELRNSQYENLSRMYESSVNEFQETREYENSFVEERSDSLNVIYRSSVSIFCPESMRENISYKVFAMVRPLLEDDTVKQKLLEVVNEAREERQESLLTLEDIKSKPIVLGNYLKIELIDNGDKFDIVIPEPYPDPQTPVDIFDEDSNNFINDQFIWRWNVTPKEKTYGQGSLEFVITPLDKDLNAMEQERRFFKIDINLKQSFVSSVWEKANRNPEWAIASIITPFLTFLAGFFAKRKKEDESKNTDEMKA